MPRALLLKKPKFNQEEAEESSGDPSNPAESKTNEQEANGPSTETSDFIDNINIITKQEPEENSCASIENNEPVKKLRRRRKRGKVKINTVKKIKTENGKQEGEIIHKKKVRNNIKGINVKVIKDAEDVSDGNIDDFEEFNQHYLKWMKKDGHTLKVWECGICHKEFMHQYTLVRHLPIHTNERNFKCDHCGKAFRQASTLCRHRAIHSDARPFLCSQCGKAFNRSSTLIAHRKTHSDNKPHVCHVCGKGFHQKGNLKNHIFTHTGERPYRCDKCDRGFNQMSNLMCHKAHAHVEKPKHICHLCGKEFPRKFSLRTHEEYRHGIKYDITGEHPVTLNVDKQKENKDVKRGRPVNSATKTITLPNGDKTIKFLSTINVNKVFLPPSVQENNGEIVEQSQGFPEVESTPEMEAMSASSLPDYPSNSPSQKESPAVSSQSATTTSILTKATGILIDPITTPAMIAAQNNGQMPFALLKPAKGIPVLVKILPTTDGKQVLVPATADDLKTAGKITVSPSLWHSNGSAIKAVQIKVPVVATVTQKMSPTGQLLIEIEGVQDTVIDSGGVESTVPNGIGTETISEDVLNTARFIENEMNIVGPVNESENTTLLSMDSHLVANEIGHVADNVEGVHLSCADALATLSAAAANLESQQESAVETMIQQIHESDQVTTTEVIQNAIENITHLNNLISS